MENPVLLSPSLDDYELIDSGGFEKLERLGDIITIRPEPQALWDKSLTEEKWDGLANAVFRRNHSSTANNGAAKNRPGGQENRTSFADERGQWELRKGTPEQWKVGYGYKDMRIRMRLGFTAFKHVGIFPEQAENWNYIYDSVQAIKAPGSTPSVLNLFAYTGGASLAAAAAGAAVTHVDSVKQVVGWARENAGLSGLEGIRWIVDDALKFAAREVRRGNRYNGIILDPPAYGRGPDGEKWVLEQHLPTLLDHCAELLEKENSFFILNLYSMGLSSLLARSTVEDVFRRKTGAGPGGNSGELYFTDGGGRNLPLGVYYRFRK